MMPIRFPSARDRVAAALVPLVALAMSACAPDGSSDRSDAGLVPDARAAASAPSSAAAPMPLQAAASPVSAERSPRSVVLNGIDLTGVGYDKGSPTAPIVMVDFSDFGCPHCGKHARETLPALEREFIATGKVFYKYMPIVMGFPNGDRAVRAAECAAEEGKFWPMHDRLYAGQQEWRKSAAHAQIYKRYTRELGLDVTRFAACIADGRTEARTERATGIAQSLGIRATPTFAIDGEGIEGALPLDIFQRILREKAAR
jgi:protein-disulfide isomerase